MSQSPVWCPSDLPVFLSYGQASPIEGDNPHVTVFPADVETPDSEATAATAEPTSSEAAAGADEQPKAASPAGKCGQRSID